GGEVFLMARPADGKYTDSDTYNLYIWQDLDRKPFYYFKGKKCFLNMQFSDDTEFNSSNDKLIRYENEKKILEALTFTTQRNHTRLGRRVQGSLIQIMAMGGDINLQEGITEEKDLGLVERLKAMVGFPDELVAEQLEEVLTSEEAVAENEKRHMRILDAIKAFGEGIIN